MLCHCQTGSVNTWNKYKLVSTFFYFQTHPSLLGVVRLIHSDRQIYRSSFFLLDMKWNESGFRPPLCTYRLNWARRTSWGWWDDCPPDTGFEIRALAVWGRARYLSVTEAPHNTHFHTWMGKKHYLFLSNRRDREPNPELWRANHHPRAPAFSPWHIRVWSWPRRYTLIQNLYMTQLMCFTVDKLVVAYSTTSKRISQSPRFVISAGPGCRKRSQSQKPETETIFELETETEIASCNRPWCRITEMLFSLPYHTVSLCSCLPCLPSCRLCHSSSSSCILPMTVGRWPTRGWIPPSWFYKTKLMCLESSRHL